MSHLLAQAADSRAITPLTWVCLVLAAGCLVVAYLAMRK